MSRRADGPWADGDGFRTIGDPDASDLAVVCCLHGDEPCGKLAVERVVDEYGEVPGVTFVLAHALACDRGRRYVDEDLNRAFPGDADAATHEPRLAVRLHETLRDHLVLDLHETVSRPTPFALTASRTDRVHEAAMNTGVERVVDIAYVDGGMIGTLEGVAVEVDGTDRRRGTDAAYRTVVGFLANYGRVDADARRSDPVVYRVYDDIPKPREGLAVLPENFERVGDGDVLARGDGEVVRAEGTHYPVLVSEDGYDGVYGFRARREGRLSELRPEPGPDHGE